MKSLVRIVEELKIVQAVDGSDQDKSIEQPSHSTARDSRPSESSYALSPMDLYNRGANYSAEAKSEHFAEEKYDLKAEKDRGKEDHVSTRRSQSEYRVRSESLLSEERGRSRSVNDFKHSRSRKSQPERKNNA